MDRNAETDWLMRLVALLLSLADAAECASSRSWLVRRHVLTILRRAEPAAHRSLLGAARDFGAPLPVQAWQAIHASMSVDDGNDRDGALDLADRFRALAMALGYLGAWADYFARRLTAIAHTRPLSSACPAGRPSAALPPPDTS